MSFVKGLEAYLQRRRAWLAGAIFVVPGHSLDNAEPPTLIPPFLIVGAHGGVFLGAR